MNAVRTDTFRRLKRFDSSALGVDEMSDETLQQQLETSAGLSACDVYESQLHPSPFDLAVAQESELMVRAEGVARGCE